MPADIPAEPWRSFLHDLDRHLKGTTELHCFGGFVVAEYYGLERATADIDIVHAVGDGLNRLAAIAGNGSALALQHRVYPDIVTVAVVPEDYQRRLIDIYPTQFVHLRLRPLERHDLVLAKLSRNADRDREDLQRLAAGPGLDVEILRTRYTEELRFQSTNPSRDDLTLQLWTEIIDEIQHRSRTSPTVCNG